MVLLDEGHRSGKIYPVQRARDEILLMFNRHGRSDGPEDKRAYILVLIYKKEEIHIQYKEDHFKL